MEHLHGSLGKHSCKLPHHRWNTWISKYCRSGVDKPNLLNQAQQWNSSFCTDKLVVWCVVLGSDKILVMADSETAWCFGILGNASKSFLQITSAFFFWPKVYFNFIIQLQEACSRLKRKILLSLDPKMNPSSVEPTLGSSLAPYYWGGMPATDNTIILRLSKSCKASMQHWKHRKSP